MRKYISVMLGCFLVAMAVMPGAYSLWQKNIEAGGMVQIRQDDRVNEETAEKVATDVGSGNEEKPVKETVNEQNDDIRNDDLQNDVKLNGEQHNEEAPGE